MLVTQGVGHGALLVCFKLVSGTSKNHSTRPLVLVLVLVCACMCKRHSEAWQCELEGGRCGGARSAGLWECGGRGGGLGCTCLCACVSAL